MSFLNGFSVKCLKKRPVDNTCSRCVHVLWNDIGYWGYLRSSRWTWRLIYSLTHLYRWTFVANYSNSTNFTTHWLINLWLETLTLAFLFWQFNLHLKKHKSGAHLCRLPWWTKCDQILNLCLPQNLFSWINRKSNWTILMLFDKGTRLMLSSRLTYKKMSSLQHHLETE